MSKITITIDDEAIELDAELFRQYKAQAFEALDKAEEAKGELKDTIDTVAEVTDLKKGLVSKFFKRLYKAELDAASAEAKTMQALRAVLDGTAVES